MTFEGGKKEHSYLVQLYQLRFTKGDCGDILSRAAHTGAFEADEISPSFFVERPDFSASPLLSDAGFSDFDSGFNPISSTGVSYFSLKREQNQSHLKIISQFSTETLKCKRNLGQFSIRLHFEGVSATTLSILEDT